MTGDLLKKIERLEEALGEIARQSDGHRRSRLYVDGDNVALANVRNIALFALAQDRDYVERKGEWTNWPTTEQRDIPPAETAFLDLLARDIDEHPERLVEIDGELPGRIESLVGGMDIDLEAPIEGDVDL
jgi:antitoxin PrlF